MDTRQLDDRLGFKVPHLKHGVMNLLRVVDLNEDDKMTL